MKGEIEKIMGIQRDKVKRYIEDESNRGIVNIQIENERIG